MEQNGADHEGIWGFMERDIRKCADKCASTKCVYCDCASASIQCKHKSCKKTFHLTCGVQNGCLFQFTDAFSSYCGQHHRSIIKDKQVKGHDKCMICWELMGDYNPITSIPSCCNQGWFHANCIRKSAIEAGYLFHCPMCGNQNDAYLVMIRKRGIYVPERDATWELTKNAFDSLLFVYTSCDAKTCHCPNGRKFTIKRKRSKWHLLKCIYCGSKGIHFGCSPHDLQKYKCHECTVARSQSQSTQVSQPSQSHQPHGANQTSSKATEVADLVLVENSNNSEEPSKARSPSPNSLPSSVLIEATPKETANSVNNLCSDASKPQNNIQSMEITSSTGIDPPVVGNRDALVSVAEFSANPLKERAIILAQDQPPPGTQYVDDLIQLSKDRLDLLLLRKRR